MVRSACQHAAWLGAAALLSVGCNELLGYDDGTLASAPIISTGTLTGSGSDTSTATGSGGAERIPCMLGPGGADPCPAGDKCSVVDETTGETACTAAGFVSSWARCTADAECDDQLWCDHATGVCKPLCTSETDCPAGASCLQAQAGGGGVIPGLRICTAHCDPLDAASCNQAYGTTNCLHGSQGFDCFASGDGGLLSGCPNFLDCGPPYTCFYGSCVPWCDVQAGICSPETFTCYSYSPPIFYAGVEVGCCLPE